MNELNETTAQALIALEAELNSAGVKRIAEQNAAFSRVISDPDEVSVCSLQYPEDDLCASHAYKAIMEYVKEFERSLDDQHDVAVKLTSFGTSITMSVTQIRYSDPNLLIFDGYVGEDFATLVQHLSQLNFLLIAVPRKEPEKPKRPIGFSAD